MKINTLGDKNNSAVVLIPGMFCDDTSVLPFAKYLQDSFYVILPTLDGHYKNSENYTDVHDQARKLIKKLHEMDIKKIALLQGTSMGAEVAFAVANECDIEIEHCFFDGGPFFMFPKWFRFFMQKKFEGFVKKFKGKTKEDALNDKFVQWLGGDNLKDYGEMIDSFVKSSDFMTKESIKGIVKTCYACELPEISNELQEKMIFHWSEKEPAQKSKKRLMKQYQYAKYIEYPGNGHAGFQAAKSKEYAEYLREIVKGY